MTRFPSPAGTHRGPRPRLLAALAAWTLAFAAAAPLPAWAAEDPDPNVVYDVQVPLAPVLLDGTYPLRLELPGLFLDGTVDLATDVKGNLTGTLTIGPTVLDVKGKAKYRNAESSISLLARGDGDRIKFKGTLAADGFEGNCSGKGTLAPGKNTFAIDVSGASPAVAAITVVIAPGSKSKLSGDATVVVDGTPLLGKSVRKAGRKLSVSVHADAFRWSATGPVEGDPGAVTVSWKARGYGADVSGEGMDLAVVPPPSGILYADAAPLWEAEEPAAADVPTHTGGPVDQWSISPALPAGLAINAATGTISGTPAAAVTVADYTVTAGNLAGSTEATVSIQVRGNRAYSFAADARTLSDDELRHFLKRTHFGVKASELAAVKAATLPAYVDDMLDFKSGTAVEAAAFPELVNASDPANLQGGFPSGNQISRWWSRIMVETDRPFQEAMSFFWHDHMPVAWDVLDGGMSHFEVNYINLLRHSGNGNLRDLYLAIARDPAMLVYLSGYINTVGAPNENFGREFWELFSLGVDNGYTQTDIAQAARAFTGYQMLYNGATGQFYMQFRTNRHDPNSKTILGVVIPGQNTDDSDFAKVVDITLANRSVDRYMTKKIFEYFCYENPPIALVDAMAPVLKGPPGGPNWELKPFLKALFTSEAFFSNRSKQARVKSPLEFTVGLIRSTGLQITIPNLDNYLSTLGHRPGLPPTVNGWPLGTLWYGPDAMVNRANLAYFIVGDTVRQASVGINIANILPPVPQRTDQTVLDTVSDLMGVDLTPAEQASLITYLNSVRLANGTISPDAFIGTSQGQLDERVRGLVYILAQHPNFQVK